MWYSSECPVRAPNINEEMSSVSSKSGPVGAPNGGRMRPGTIVSGS